MISQRVLLVLCLASGLNASAEARAAVPDPSDDVHCSVLTLYFLTWAEQTRAPPEQRRAAKVMDRWYEAKVRSQAVQRWGGMQGYERAAAPIIKAIDRDPMSMKDEMMSCTSRAIADPGFKAFTRKLAP